jgi:flagellin
MEYTNTVTTENAEATSADLIGALADGDTVTYTGTDTGLGVAANANTYTYDADNDTMTFNADDAAAADIASFITPSTAGETTAATVSIGGSTQDVIIDSNGVILNP